MGVGVYVRIEYDLRDAFPVAQIDEYQIAVVTSPVHPTGQRHLLPHMRFPELSAAYGF